jgi:hypothetical protein
MTDPYRSDLAQALFEACRGRRHPTQGGEHWNVADRLRPFIAQVWQDAYGMGRDDEANDAELRTYPPYIPVEIRRRDVDHAHMLAVYTDRDALIEHLATHHGSMPSNALWHLDTLNGMHDVIHRAGPSSSTATGAHTETP